MKSKITLAGGCFWCLEAVYERLNGVEQVVSGYCGGDVDQPTYQMVCTGNTGHAEAIQITYEDSLISDQTVIDLFLHFMTPLH